MPINSVDLIRLVRSGWLTGRVHFKTAEEGVAKPKGSPFLSEPLDELRCLTNSPAPRACQLATRCLSDLTPIPLYYLLEALAIDPTFENSTVSIQVTTKIIYKLANQNLSSRRMKNHSEEVKATKKPKPEKPESSCVLSASACCVPG